MRCRVNRRGWNDHLGRSANHKMILYSLSLSLSHASFLRYILSYTSPAVSRLPLLIQLSIITFIHSLHSYFDVMTRIMFRAIKLWWKLNFHCVTTLPLKVYTAIYICPKYAIKLFEQLSYSIKSFVRHNTQHK